MGNSENIVASANKGVSLVGRVLEHVGIVVSDDADVLDLELEGAVDPVHQGDAHAGDFIDRRGTLQVLNKAFARKVKLGERNLKVNINV